LDNETSGGGIWFRTNAVGNSNLSLYTGGNSGFNSATDDSHAIIQSYSTSLPQIEAAYNSTNYYTEQVNSSGNVTLTASGGTINLAGIPTAATATAGTATTQIATTAFVQAAVTSGTYTPTLTNTTNITSSTLEQALYTRIGNIVHVNIALLVNPTTASTASVLTFTLPITTSNGSQVNIGLGALDINSAGVATYTSGIVTMTSTTTGTLSFICTSLAGTSNVNIQFDYTL
jgi:hypothetical protein